MTEKQYTPDKQKPIEKKQKIAPAPIKTEKKEEAKEEIKEQEKKVESAETKPEEEKKKGKKKEIPKKDKAIVRGNDLRISKKHSMAICDYIRGKKIENMTADLEKVVSLKRPIPMKGEIPHRKGNLMSGRYPVNASKVFIKLLRTLSANCSVNSVDNPIITVAIANDASRPFKRGGSMRFKRTNVYLEARENKKEIKEKK
ncbi:MAG: hypothetical protein KKB21_03330 [Nanoarchaeota archaeon]|nr:hypothetical protein [Nanoarchaeota archaeon]MBU4086583.1 hypothetical protein [Nanoarchaeota archaeon]